MLLKIKRNLHDFENIVQLHLVAGFLIGTTLFFQLLVKSQSFLGLILFFAALFFLKTYYISLRKLQYTYWTLSVASLVFVLALTDFDTLTSALPVLGYFTLKIIEFYFISSPIYYPWFNWWEYDFRYRNDLVAYVTFNEKKQEARVTDIRRNAGCITLFEKLPVGSSIVVSMHENQNAISLEGKIISVRETTLGRGYSYGVSFSWENELTKEYYSKMKSSWNKGRLQSKRDRVEESGTNIH